MDTTGQGSENLITKIPTLHDVEKGVVIEANALTGKVLSLLRLNRKVVRGALNRPEQYTGGQVKIGSPFNRDKAVFGRVSNVIELFQMYRLNSGNYEGVLCFSGTQDDVLQNRADWERITESWDDKDEPVFGAFVVDGELRGLSFYDARDELAVTFNYGYGPYTGKVDETRLFFNINDNQRGLGTKIEFRFNRVEAIDYIALGESVFIESD